MKKKLFILILAASICGSVLFSGNAFADVDNCTISNTSATTPKEYCAGSVFRKTSGDIRSKCTKGSSFRPAQCKEFVKEYVLCGTLAGVNCSDLKTPYVNSVVEILQNNNVDPCSNATDSSISQCKCTNWSYYYSSRPNDCSTSPSGGGGTGGGSSSSGSSSGSSSSSSDDNSGSSAGVVDPAAVNEGDCTSILPNAWCTGDDGIQQIIRLIILILTGSVVVAGTVGIIICGFLWMTARENEQQVATAKKRMLDIIIGVVAWVLLALLANLFIPKPSDEIQNNVNGNVSATKDVEA